MPANALRRWARAEALPVAQELRRLLEPACERIELAGSLRRRKADVGDIELLCLPRPVMNLFGEPDATTDELDRAIRSLMQQGVLAKRAGKNGVMTYGVKNKLLLHVPSGIPLDVFSTDARNWGMAMFIRTGPKDWNVRAMARFQQTGMQGHAYGGVTTRDGEVACPDEQTVFTLLGWPYLAPEQRQ